MTKQVQEVSVKQGWEVAVSAGLELREEKDNCQWQLGALAEQVASKFGGKSIKQFSKDISIPYNSFREYYRVHTRIPVPDRIPHLSYRHHQKAAATDNPSEWLKKASDGQWTSEYLGLQISKAKGKDVPEEPLPKIDKCDECGKWEMRNVLAKDICHCGYVQEIGY